MRFLLENVFQMILRISIISWNVEITTFQRLQFFFYFLFIIEHLFENLRNENKNLNFIKKAQMKVKEAAM